MRELKRVAILLVVAKLALCSAAIADVIGPHPDGISYEIVSSSAVYKASPETCGYNDSGLANQGKYDRESREYTEWKANVAVRHWHETVDVFVECFEP